MLLKHIHAPCFCFFTIIAIDRCHECKDQVCCHVQRPVKAIDMTAGYTGFIPECDHNAQACHEASAVDQPRQDGEASTMLFTMDQYSRQRVPLYTGHRPTALSNLTAAQPAHAPTLQTTQVSSQLTSAITICTPSAGISGQLYRPVGVCCAA